LAGAGFAGSGYWLGWLLSDVGEGRCGNGWFDDIRLRNTHFHIGVSIQEVIVGFESGFRVRKRGRNGNGKGCGRGARTGVDGFGFASTLTFQGTTGEVGLLILGTLHQLERMLTL
jgi:hypothetical protein